MENKNGFYLKLFCIGIFINGAVVTCNHFFFELPLVVGSVIGGVGVIIALIGALNLAKIKK